MSTCPTRGVESPDILWFVRIRGALTALCVMVALVGCSDDPEPRTLPPITSASPSPSVVPMPSEAAAETPEGAAAFARYWIATLESALATGDASQLRSLSGPTCSSCTNLIGAAEDVKAQGQSIEGAGFAVDFAEAPPLEEGEVVVELRYRRASGKLLNSQGEVVSQIAPEGPINAQMRLSRQGSSWIVTGFRQVDS